MHEGVAQTLNSVSRLHGSIGEQETDISEQQNNSFTFAIRR